MATPYKVVIMPLLARIAWKQLQTGRHAAYHNKQ